MSKKKEIQPPQYETSRILADSVNDTVGSGRFIAIQSLFLLFYILFQVFAPQAWAFDKYPFILLNLLLSFQAGYTGPFIVWAQNRAAKRDREVMGYIRDMVASIKHVLESLLRVEKKVDKELIEIREWLIRIEEKLDKLN